jgi:hypothetical protein
MLFSANTQSCGSVSAFCSSTASSIFQSDGDNLVRVEEIETNKKYAVYGNVKKYSEAGNRRSCTVNIYLTKRDGTTCQEIVKTFVQDKSINCDKALTTSSWDVEHYLVGKTFDNNDSSVQTIAYSRQSDETNSKIFFLLEGNCPSWLGGDVDNFRYVYADGRWVVKGTLTDNSTAGSSDREVEFTQIGYILDDSKPVNPGFEYRAGILKKMAGTKCGEITKKVKIGQYGCNCKHAWTSSTTSETIGYTAGYTDVDINSYLNGCARLTAVESIDECDWLTCNIVGTGTVSKLRLIARENETPIYRSCNIKLYITDSSGNDPCEKKFLVRQIPHELDCTSCESVNAMGYYVPYKSSNEIKADGTANGYSVRYEKSLEDSPCNGTVTFTFDSDGISHPVINPSVTKEYDGSHVLCYFSADPNTESTTRSIKAVAHYRNGSLSDCTKDFTIKQDYETTPTPTYSILTKVNKGTVAISGTKASKIQFRTNDSYGYIYNYNVEIIMDGPGVAVSYSSIIGHNITGVTVTTDAGEEVRASVSPTTIESSTTLVTVTLTGVSCSSSSYDFKLNHTQGGATDSTPIVFNPGERKKIGELQNSIPALYADCCQIELSTTQTSVFGDFEVVNKTSGGYELYATAKTGLSTAQVAPIDVTWSYTNSSGKKVFPPSVGNTGTIYLQNGTNA